MCQVCDEFCDGAEMRYRYTPALNMELMAASAELVASLRQDGERRRLLEAAVARAAALLGAS
jgi:hypothetical protein